ncbi:unnamed protein product [Vitrella brassicaformis CCMP3155]|uniref:non-specific serine/threonine protein kinase n=1 Tax=Vitrella brassicaformis (strain CCMP3155) TaxID=1169540 RepID=A0A0G4EVN5_VITBC|nr:unnamed protein product [Vitrella brassicaformis CCMP3155]|eukprot:CEM02707.1 unnamed protein product [Vitrella brassicaformis CCMP3155]
MCVVAIVWIMWCGALMFGDARPAHEIISPSRSVYLDVFSNREKIVNFIDTVAHSHEIQLSQEFRHVLISAMDPEPSSRPSVSELKAMRFFQLHWEPFKDQGPPVGSQVWTVCRLPDPDPRRPGWPPRIARPHRAEGTTSTGSGTTTITTTTTAAAGGGGSTQTRPRNDRSSAMPGGGLNPSGPVDRKALIPPPDTSDRAARPPASPSPAPVPLAAAAAAAGGGRTQSIALINRNTTDSGSVHMGICPRRVLMFRASLLHGDFYKPSLSGFRYALAPGRFGETAGLPPEVLTGKPYGQGVDVFSGGRHGEVCFMPPEVLTGNSYEADADVFAAGAITFGLKFGQTPYEMLGERAFIEVFSDVQKSAKFIDHVAHHYSTNMQVPVDVDLLNIMKDMLHPVPCQRPSPEELLRRTFFQVMPEQLN